MSVRIRQRNSGFSRLSKQDKTRHHDHSVEDCIAAGQDYFIGPSFASEIPKVPTSSHF